jgi:hypothetical protein
VAAHGDLANRLARETLLTRVSQHRHVTVREAGQATGGRASLRLDLQLVIEVDPEREILE